MLYVVESLISLVVLHSVTVAMLESRFVCRKGAMESNDITCAAERAYNRHGCMNNG